MKKLLCLMLILAALTVGACAAWDDVPEDHWAADAIAEMEKEGIVNGFPDGQFHPNDTLTRAQFLAMVVRAAAPEEVPEQDPNHDWWWNLLDLAEEANLLDNLPWEPSPTSMNTAIPRQEAAVLMVRANEIWNGLYCKSIGSLTPFRDPIPEQYTQPVMASVVVGLMEGYPDGTFRPGDSLTRAEGCILAQRLWQRSGLLEKGEIQVENHGTYLYKLRLEDDGSVVLTGLEQSSGRVIQTLEIPVEGNRVLEEMHRLPPETWRDAFEDRGIAPGSHAFWGPIGFFVYAKDGTFTQVTDRAVLDCWGISAIDGFVALTMQPGTWSSFSGGGMEYLAGNEVLRIHSDGTVETLLSNTPAHGLNLTDITAVLDGVVRVKHEFVMGMADFHSYEYAVENGKLRALVHEPGNGWSGYTEEEAKTEQARLDAAGCGVGSAG